MNLNYNPWGKKVFGRVLSLSPSLSQSFSVSLSLSLSQTQNISLQDQVCDFVVFVVIVF